MVDFNAALSAATWGIEIHLQSLGFNSLHPQTQENQLLLNFQAAVTGLWLFISRRSHLQHYFFVGAILVSLSSPSLPPPLKTN